MWESTANNGITSIADTVLSSWTTASAAVGNWRAFISYAKAASSASNAITYTFDSSTAYKTVSCTEFSGNDTSTLLDVDGGSATSTDAAPTMNITTGVANALIVGVVTHTSSAATTLTPGASYTQIGEEEDNNAHVAHNFERRIVTTATTYAVDWTFDNARQWLTYAVSFRPSTGSATRQRCIGCGTDKKVIGE